MCYQKLLHEPYRSSLKGFPPSDESQLRKHLDLWSVPVSLVSNAMNSYPPELLAQLAPVMFVAGLDAETTSHPSASISAKGNDFALLVSRLRETLQAQRKVAIWQPEKTKTFQIVLVDKDIRYPPRKVVPPEDPMYSASHSPLSPLTPTSPLHPDGLIAPIWIRKHTSLVPSVFVLFLRIYEHPSSATNPLDSPDLNRERERETEERKRDTELAAEVAQRKKGTNDRGIKLTVVLMTTRKMLGENWYFATIGV